VAPGFSVPSSTDAVLVVVGDGDVRAVFPDSRGGDASCVSPGRP
jgi:hypothetical protein